MSFLFLVQRGSDGMDGSSFTKQIVDARKAAIAEGGEAGLRMRNVVEYFG